jgi:hypothetical protein
MKNPYTYTLAEVLGALPEWKDEVESMVDQLQGLHENEKEWLAKREMERRQAENLANTPRLKKKKIPVVFDMGA